MGSSFSIINDTNEPVWVSDGVCHEALWGRIGAVAGVVTLGAGAAIVAGGAGGGAAGALASAAAFEGAVAEGAMIATAEGIVYTSALAAGVAAATEAGLVLGINAAVWGYISTVSGLLSLTALTAEGTLAKLDAEERAKVWKFKEEVKKQLKGYKRIEPGENYKVKGSLSLVWSAYVIRNSGKMYKRNCWTAPTAGGDNKYPVSQYFSD